MPFYCSCFSDTLLFARYVDVKIFATHYVTSSCGSSKLQILATNPSPSKVRVTLRAAARVPRFGVRFGKARPDNTASFLLYDYD